MTTDEAPGSSDQYDRQRRRVLWALPTGLYLIGSRAGDAVNLMTANLVVQVCLEPKLVAVAMEAGSVTADLTDRAGAFTVSLLERRDKDVVRRFVKPAHHVLRDAAGSVTSISGHAVREVGPSRLPVLAAAAGYLACSVVRQEPLGATRCSSEKWVRSGGKPADVLRMEDTRMHYGG